MTFAIEYRCAGPLRWPEETQRLIIEGDVALADAIAAQYDLPMRQADEEEWQYRLRVARARKPCGVDLTNLVVQLPEDGAEHTIICPVCGNVARIVRYP